MDSSDWIISVYGDALHVCAPTCFYFGDVPMNGPAVSIAWRQFLLHLSPIQRLHCILYRHQPYSFTFTDVDVRWHIAEMQSCHSFPSIPSMGVCDMGYGFVKIRFGFVLRFYIFFLSSRWIFMNVRNVHKKCSRSYSFVRKCESVTILPIASYMCVLSVRMYKV